METLPPPAAFDLDAWVARSRALDLDAIPWGDVRLHRLPAPAARALRYTQDEAAGHLVAPRPQGRSMKPATSSTIVRRRSACGAPAWPAWRGSWLTVQPDTEREFLGAARKVDDTIRRLPGFASVKLLEAWIDRRRAS